MTKICFVTGHIHYHIGGAEIQSIRIAQELIRRGYEVCYLNNPIHDDNNIPEIETIGDIKVYNYKCYKRFRLFDFIKIKSLVGRINADVYYLRACIFNEGFVTFIANKKKAKTIWQCASGRSIIKYYRIKELLLPGRFIYVLVNGFNVICHDLSRLYAIKNSKCIVAQAEENRLHILKQFNRKSTIIRKGIHVSKVKSEKSKKELRVLFLRNIRKGVRHKLFLDVAKFFKDEKCYYFTAIGRISRNRNANLREFYESGVKYLGELDNQQVLRILEKTHILIDTLEEPKGLTVFSTAFLEAWSRSVVILSFGSNPDNVFEKENVGYSVKSVADCVEKIKMLSSRRDILTKIGLNARNYVLKNHNLVDEVDDLIRLF